MASLQRLKEHSGKWFVKVLLWILVLSFGLWGVGDIFRSYTSMRPVAKIGGTAISQDEFYNVLKRQINMLHHSSKTPVTGDEIRKMQLPKIVLDDLLKQAALKEEIHRLKLLVSDDVIRTAIKSDPMFHNEKGEYDSRALLAILQQNSISEGQLVNDVRSKILQNQLLLPLSLGAHLSSKYKHLLFTAIEQKVVFAQVVIKADKMPKPATIAEKDLQLFYDQQKQSFSRPEVRDVQVLELDPENIKATINVSDEAVTAAFEQRQSEFAIPEKRHLEEIVTTDAQVAKKIQSQAETAKDWSALSTKHKAQYKDHGFVSQKDLATEYASEVFSAPTGKLQSAKAVMTGQKFFRVKKVTPAKEPTLAEARKTIEADIRTQQFNDEVFDIRNKVEDAIAGGSTYDEVAKQYHLKLHIFQAVSKAGRSLDEKTVVPDYLRTTILEQAFATSEKGDTELVDGKDGAFFVARSEKIIPSFVPEFSQIQPEVQKAYEKQKQVEAAIQLATTYVKEGKSTADMARFAKANHLTVQVLQPMSYSSIHKDKTLLKTFTPSLLNKMFTLKVGQAAYGLVPSSGAIQVIQLQSKVPLSESSSREAFNKFSGGLTNMVQQDIGALYTTYLKQTLGVSMNQSIFDSIVGNL